MELTKDEQEVENKQNKMKGEIEAIIAKSGADKNECDQAIKATTDKEYAEHVNNINQSNAIHEQKMRANSSSRIQKIGSGGVLKKYIKGIIAKNQNKGIER